LMIQPSESCDTEAAAQGPSSSTRRAAPPVAGRGELRGGQNFTELRGC
jgi:hypothetical protein